VRQGVRRATLTRKGRVYATGKLPASSTLAARSSPATTRSRSPARPTRRSSR